MPRLGIMLVLLFITLTAPGCASLPKIRILHDPLTAQEHLTLGVSYESQEKLDLAISEYEAAFKKGSKETEVTALVYLGNAHAQRRDFRQAAKYYRKALAKDTQNVQALNNLAWVYLQQGIKLMEAEAMVRQALDQAPSGDPNRPGYLDTLAEILIAQGQFSEALNVLNEAESLADQKDSVLLSHIYEHKARAYDALGQTEKAHNAHQRAKALQ